MLLGCAAVTAVAGYVYLLTWRKVRQEAIEMRSARLALQPLLMAERDREYVSNGIVPACSLFIWPCLVIFLLHVVAQVCF
jgi:hypothetical protein